MTYPVGPDLTHKQSRVIESSAAISERAEKRISGTIFDGTPPTDLSLEQLTELEL